MSAHKRNNNTNFSMQHNGKKRSSSTFVFRQRHQIGLQHDHIMEDAGVEPGWLLGRWSSVSRSNQLVPSVVQETSPLLPRGRSFTMSYHIIPECDDWCCTTCTFNTRSYSSVKKHNSFLISAAQLMKWATCKIRTTPILQMMFQTHVVRDTTVRNTHSKLDRQDKLILTPWSSNSESPVWIFSITQITWKSGQHWTWDSLSRIIVFQIPDTYTHIKW